MVDQLRFRSNMVDFSKQKSGFIKWYTRLILHRKTIISIVYIGLRYQNYYMPQDPTPGSTLPRSPGDPQGEVRGAEAGQSHAEARRRGAEICSVARIEKK